MKFEIIKNKLLSNFSKNKDLKEPVLANTITEHKPTYEAEEKAVETEAPQEKEDSSRNRSTSTEEEERRTKGRNL